MTSHYIIREVQRADAAAWIALREALWPGGEPGEHAGEVARFFAGELHEPIAVFLAVDSADAPIGFVELSIRNIVDGCATDRVAYIEGLYVAPEARRRGVGNALIRTSEEWGRGRGCTELGSDALHDNHVSIAVHRAAGFEQGSTVVCFRKQITAGERAGT